MARIPSTQIPWEPRRLIQNGGEGLILVPVSEFTPEELGRTAKRIKVIIS